MHFNIGSACLQEIYSIYGTGSGAGREVDQTEFSWKHPFCFTGCIIGLYLGTSFYSGRFF